jgi:NADH-quinone oxidoreductase subunit L
MAVIAVVGVITLFFGGLLALVQDDIKKVLAYSTVSQLGYMIAALGVGGYTAGIFHLFTHGFFKALLFLGSGSLIHAVHSNNMSDMGGMRKAMPTRSGPSSSGRWRWPGSR